jgi:hypothetical protein
MESNKNFDALRVAIRRAGAILEGKAGVMADLEYKHSLAKLSELTRIAPRTGYNHIRAGFGGTVIGGVIVGVGYGAYALYRVIDSPKWSDRVSLSTDRGNFSPKLRG